MQLNYSNSFWTKSSKPYGEINFEYPANINIEPSDELKSWGFLREDKLPIIRIATLAPEAQKSLDRVDGRSFT